MIVDPHLLFSPRVWCGDKIRSSAAVRYAVASRSKNAYVTVRVNAAVLRVQSGRVLLQFCAGEVQYGRRRIRLRSKALQVRHQRYALRGLITSTM